MEHHSEVFVMHGGGPGAQRSQELCWAEQKRICASVPDIVQGDVEGAN